MQNNQNKAQPVIFVINLKRSPDRRQAMEEKLSHLNLPFRFFEGVDGSALSKTDMTAYAGPRCRFLFGKDLTSGEMGCLLSHRGIYRQMMAEGIPTALILEDDTILADDFEQVIDALLSVPVKWDMIRFLCRPKNYKQTRVLGPLVGKYKLGRSYGLPGGAYGYLLTLRGAELLNRKMDKNWVPVDTLHGESWRTGLQVFNVVPSPVSYIEDEDLSTIGNARFNKPKNQQGLNKFKYLTGRFIRKSYELLFKRAYWMLTWPGDQKRARRINSQKSKS